MERTTDKSVLSLSKMEKQGYPRRKLQEDAKGDDFAEFGFRYKRTYYFILPKYEKYIARKQMEEIQLRNRKAERAWSE